MHKWQENIKEKSKLGREPSHKTLCLGTLAIGAGQLGGESYNLPSGTPYVPKKTTRGILPNPDPFTSFVVAVVACKKRRKEGWLTLLELGFDNCLASKAGILTGQVIIIKQAQDRSGHSFMKRSGVNPLMHSDKHSK